MLILRTEANEAWSRHTTNERSPWQFIGVKRFLACGNVLMRLMKNGFSLFLTKFSCLAFRIDEVNWLTIESKTFENIKFANCRVPLLMNQGVLLHFNLLPIAVSSQQKPASSVESFFFTSIAVQKGNKGMKMLESVGWVAENESSFLIFSAIVHSF